ncbi:unnamed protein product, partial [Anisakis simplex]|uniref:VWFA domain-containing protein n=1 Tax=Anisakis simplex TaxID=6269 RepID=A0A0M3JCY4_ANISI
MIVLDTSGSVYKAFADEREFAKGLIQSINSSAFVDGRLQVGLIRFSSAPSIVIPFSRNRTQDEIVEKISEIEFTGQSTRIAAAVDLAIAELETARRKDATQVFILISDGHGQEYWSVVQATGKKLQSIDAEVFSATTSQDYN